jgi:CheY-like chemotaxis protein
MPTVLGPVLVVGAELMAATRVESLLSSLGCPVRQVEPTPAAVTAACAGGGGTLLVLDLAVPADTRRAVWEATHAAALPVVAFGSHIDGPVLAEAARAGAAVLTRGALARELPELLARHLSAHP